MLTMTPKMPWIFAGSCMVSLYHKTRAILLKNNPCPGGVNDSIIKAGRLTDKNRGINVMKKDGGIVMPYEPIEDELYENALFVNELLKARDYIGQAFHVMDNTAQWGVPVMFSGHEINTGTRKGLHTYWTDHVSQKGSEPAQYSGIQNIPVKKVQKSIRNCLLFAMRMNPP